jgi:hypothetical protein
MRVSPRFAVPALVAFLLALVPTVVHNYLGLSVDDGVRAAAVAPELPGMLRTPTNRSAAWARLPFSTDDFVEYAFRTPRGEVRLLVVRSYDAKTLYHHPENVAAYGKGLEPVEVTSLADAPDVPVHRLVPDPANPDAGERLEGRYALLYDGEFVGNPYWAQLVRAPQLLTRGRIPMTLLFATGPLVARGEEVGPTERVLAAAVASVKGQLRER